MTIDVFTFNGEFDLLEVRLNVLDKYVDQFVIVEAPTTFSGKTKPLYYEQEKERYAKWHHKIKYFVVDENYTPEELKQAEESPNTVGASHWVREFVQKESIKKALTHLSDFDTCYIGDVDEIWDVDHPIYDISSECWKLKLKVYIYYFNNRSNEIFNGTLYGKWRNIKNECLNHLRTNSQKTLRDCGWHFTSLKDILRRKLEDSYTAESYATPWVMDNLEKNIEKNRDFLGRDFEYHIDNVDLPKFLLDNRSKYEHLFK